MKNYISLLFIFSILIACNKDDQIQHANEKENNMDNCISCPSNYFANHPEIAQESCDDFMQEDWPSLPGDTIGYTQGGKFPITVGEDSWSFWTEENGYMGGHLIFELSGAYQTAKLRFHDIETSLNDVQIIVNNAVSSISLDSDFPVIIDGVTISIDMAPTNIFMDYESLDIILTGQLDDFEVIAVEGYFTELCISQPYSTEIIASTESIHFESFFAADGTPQNLTGYYPSRKTPFGYYGLNPATLAIDFTQFLAYTPSKVGFVRASNSPEDNFELNIELPGTPLLYTTFEELETTLSPYGYTVEKYTTNDGLLWQDNTAPITGSHVDSILIMGKEITRMKLGIDMTNAELRNTCTYYE